MYMHGYCTQCNQTVLENFNLTLQANQCKYFDRNFCNSQCGPNLNNEFTCVYIETLPMCYSSLLNRYMAHVDYLHYTFIMYYSIWNIIVMICVSTIFLIFTTTFILLPTLFVTCYEFKKAKSCWYNFTSFFRIKTT